MRNITRLRHKTSNNSLPHGGSPRGARHCPNSSDHLRVYSLRVPIHLVGFGPNLQSQLIQTQSQCAVANIHRAEGEGALGRSVVVVAAVATEVDHVAARLCHRLPADPTAQWAISTSHNSLCWRVSTPHLNTPLREIIGIESGSNNCVWDVWARPWARRAEAPRPEPCRIITRNQHHPPRGRSGDAPERGVWGAWWRRHDPVACIAASAARQRTGCSSLKFRSVNRGRIAAVICKFTSKSTASGSHRGWARAHKGMRVLRWFQQLPRSCGSRFQMQSDKVDNVGFTKTAWRKVWANCGRGFNQIPSFIRHQRDANRPATTAQRKKQDSFAIVGRFPKGPGAWGFNFGSRASKWIICCQLPEFDGANCGPIAAAVSIERPNSLIRHHCGARAAGQPSLGRDCKHTRCVFGQLNTRCELAPNKFSVQFQKLHNVNVFSNWWLKVWLGRNGACWAAACHPHGGAGISTGAALIRSSFPNSAGNGGINQLWRH